MPNPLATKLSHYSQFSPADLERLDELCCDVADYNGGKDLIREGDRPEVVFLLIDGWACRYKLLPDGGRQIMAYLIPGDLCDVQIFILHEMDHAIGLIGPARVAAIPKAKMIALFDESPALTRALWWSTLVDEGVLREWLVNIGRRDAFDRLAHLFAELWLRMRMVGLTQDGSFDLPMRQADLGDTLGLTPVHVNRTLQAMRAEGLIESRPGRLHIPDVERLMEVSDFRSNYLHLEPRHR